MTVLNDTPGHLYVLCFSEALGNALNRRALASHYLGFAVDLPRRLADHAAGRGSSLTQAAVARGITWTVYYRPGTPALERWLKGHYKQTPCCCPRCAGPRAKYGFQPLDQRAFELVEPLPDLPDPPALAMDGYELRYIKSWRLLRGTGLPIAGLDDTTVDIPF